MADHTENVQNENNEIKTENTDQNQVCSKTILHQSLQYIVLSIKEVSTWRYLYNREKQK